MRKYKHPFRITTAAGCLLALVLLSSLLSTTSAENQSGKISVTIRDPFFGGMYGSCILIEQSEERPGLEKTSNSVPIDARKYELKHKLVADSDNRTTEANLTPGVYRLRVLSRGYEEFISEQFKLSSGETKTFDITMRMSMSTQQFGVQKPPFEDPLVTAQAKGTKRLVSFKTILQTSSSGIRERENVIVTNAQDWESLWNRIYRTSASRPELPSLDFKDKVVIVSSLGEINTGGYGIEIIRAVETDDAINLWVKTTSPGGGAVTMAFTQPIHVIEMKRVDKKIMFVRPRYQSPCL